MRAYYNEIDPTAAEWVRELIKDGLVTDGEVDERSIEDVLPADLRGFDRCHFFAGIAAWDYALNLAGWEGTVWTGSCPCQPFSTAGKRGGFDDERHLWPAWFHLIEICRPHTIFGEQVASKDGLTWLDLVSADVEGIGYTIGAVDIPAAGVGAPHKRQRFFFGVGLADANGNEPRGRHREAGGAGKEIRVRSGVDVANGGSVSGLDDARNGKYRPERIPAAETNGISKLDRSSGRGGRIGGTSVNAGNVGISNGERFQGIGADNGTQGRQDTERPLRLPSGTIRATKGFWSDAEWLWCKDEYYRPIEPGTFPLVNGAAARMGRLRGYGNAISPWAAKAFIESWREVNGAVDSV